MTTLRVWDGAEWVYLTGGAAILQQDNAPGSPAVDDLWIDTDAAPIGSIGSTVVGARVGRAATQALAAMNTYYAITMDTEVFDYGGLWVVGAPTRLTIPTGQDGLWMVGYTVAAASAWGDQKLLHGVIRKNGTDIGGTYQGVSVSGVNFWPQHTLAAPTVLAAADYLELFVSQDQANGATVLGSIWAYRIGPTS